MILFLNAIFSLSLLLLLYAWMPQDVIIFFMVRLLYHTFDGYHVHRFKWWWGNYRMLLLLALMILLLIILYSISLGKYDSFWCFWEVNFWDRQHQWGNIQAIYIYIYRAVLIEELKYDEGKWRLYFLILSFLTCRFFPLESFVHLSKNSFLKIISGHQMQMLKEPVGWEWKILQ